MIPLFGCADAGNDPLSVISITDPPDATTRLPDIAETVTHSVSYSIGDTDYLPTHTYRIVGYFRASDAPIEVFDQAVTRQSDSALEISFDIPPAFPPTESVIEPYRLYLELQDDTAGTPGVLSTSSDTIYQKWDFEGTWYDIGQKIDIAGKWMYVFDEQGDNIYRMSMKGTVQNLPGPEVDYSVTHQWDQPSEQWVAETNPAVQTLTYTVEDGKLTFFYDDGTIHAFLSDTPFTFNGAFAGKWWTDEIKIDSADAGTILFLYDNGFEVRRDDKRFSGDDQAVFPIVERGDLTVDTATKTLTLTRTHTGTYDTTGDPYRYEEVDPDQPTLVYTMTYEYDGTTTPAELTLTGASGGRYSSDGAGITYEK